MLHQRLGAKYGRSLWSSGARARVPFWGGGKARCVLCSIEHCFQGCIVWGGSALCVCRDGWAGCMSPEIVLCSWPGVGDRIWNWLPLCLTNISSGIWSGGEDELNPAVACVWADSLVELAGVIYHLTLCTLARQGRTLTHGCHQSLPK